MNKSIILTALLTLLTASAVFAAGSATQGDTVTLQASTRCSIGVATPWGNTQLFLYGQSTLTAPDGTVLQRTTTALPAGTADFVSQKTLVASQVGTYSLAARITYVKYQKVWVGSSRTYVRTAGECTTLPNTDSVDVLAKPAPAAFSSYNELESYIQQHVGGDHTTLLNDLDTMLQYACTHPITDKQISINWYQSNAQYADYRCALYFTDGTTASWALGQLPSPVFGGNNQCWIDMSGPSILCKRFSASYPYEPDTFESMPFGPASFPVVW